MLSNTLRSKVIPLSYPIIIISLCACFLFYKYVLQVYPSIMTESLMREFKLSGAGLGNLAATFYYTYMITQIFVGVLLDKYSTRWLTSMAIFICALGSIIFSSTHSLLLAEISRALMGAGVAFATVAYMKLAANWFSPKRYAFVGGLLATAAMAGAICGQAPLAYLIDDLGWRYSLYLIGLAGIILAVLFLLIVNDHPKKEFSATKTLPISWNDILSLLKNKQNWLLTFYSGLAFSPLAIFGGLWGNPFLQQAYEINPTQAASLISLVFIGLGLGSPILGILSDRLNDRKNVMFVCTLISSLALIFVLYCHPLPIWLLSSLLFVFGFGLGAFMLVFTMGKELNKPALVATVIAMINTSEALLDSITEPGIGKLLDLLWDGKLANGVHYFSLHSYHLALGVLPLYLCIATLLLIWIKEK